MDRVSFDGLELIKQIEYINTELESNTLRNICTNIKIDRATVRDRFKKLDYVFSKENNKYIKEGEINTKINTDNTVQNKQNKQGSRGLQNTINTNALDKTNRANKQDIRDLENTINTNALLDKIKELETRVDLLENNINTKINATNTNEEINIMEFKGDTETRAFRIYGDVQKEFKAFCKKHNQYKVQDIISTALMEYMRKEKKKEK